MRCQALGGGMHSTLGRATFKGNSTGTKVLTLVGGVASLLPVDIARVDAATAHRGVWVNYGEIHKFLRDRGWVQAPSGNSFFKPPGPPVGCKQCERYLVCSLEGRKLDAQVQGTSD